MKTEENLAPETIEQTNTQSFGNTAWGFFKSSFRYVKSMVVKRYPIAHISGIGFTNTFAGLFLENLEPDGSLKVMQRAAEAAEKHPSKMASWYLGPSCCILPTTVAALEQYQKKHDTAAVLRQVPGVSDIVPNPILFNEQDVAKTKRSAYAHALKEADRVQLMKIFLEHMQKDLTGKNEEQAIDLRTVIYESLLHVVVHAFIRENPTPEQLKQAKDFSLKATTEGFDFQSIFKWMLPPALVGFVNNHPNFFYWLFPQTLYDVFYKTKSEDKDIDAFKANLRKKFKEIFLDNNTNSENLLHKLSDITKENHENKNLNEEEYAIDDGIILLLAGLETSASLMMNAFKELCKNPKILERLREELQSLPPLNPQSNAEDIKKWFDKVIEISYIQNLISEILRLYPPTPIIIPRPVAEDESIILGSGEYQIKVQKGDFVLVSPWVFGRSKEIWGSDALTINPDRWEQLTTEQRKASVVFGWGKHLCIGKDFAKQTAEAFTAAMFSLHNFELEKGCNDDEVSLKQGSLKPSKPLMAFVTARAEDKNIPSLQKEEFTDSPHP